MYLEKIILEEGVRLFNLDTILEKIGGFSNNVYKGIRGNEIVVIKYYSNNVYQKESILAELDWLMFLSEAGLNVAKPLVSINGKFIETIYDLKNDTFFNTLLFEEAKGNLVNTQNQSVWNNGLFYKWGKVLGRIHALSKQYLPNENVKRQQWNEGPLFTMKIQNQNISRTVKVEWEKYIVQMNQFPKDANCYGIIHNDLHYQNFYLHNNELVLFDFGDCEHNWFIYDIAICIYHASQTVDENYRNEFAKLFIDNFLTGYLTENKLEEYWFKQIPFFLNYRQLYSFTYFTCYLYQDGNSDTKVQNILRAMKERIEKNIPFLDLKFDDFDFS